MPCKGIYDNKGRMTGIACSMVSRRKVCHICGMPMTRLCDASNEDGTSCDLPMCDRHSHRIGEDTDVCDKHFTRMDAKKAVGNRIEREESRNKVWKAIQQQFDEWEDKVESKEKGKGNE